MAAHACSPLAFSSFRKSKAVNGKYVYERRTLRIIIQERFYSLKSLASARDIGQVLLDVACGTCPLLPSATPIPNHLPRSHSVHHWLYKISGILHRDLSLNDIMCRFFEEVNTDGGVELKVYGGC